MRFKFFILNFFILLISIFFTLIILEILCRFLVDYEKNFYASLGSPPKNGFIIHPYGKIPVNSYGFYDEEFDFDNKKKKIAYFGDSITYGVGAGYPYRFTEYLDKIDEQFDHLNLSGGLGGSLKDWNYKYENFLLEKKIDRLVYIMNLNDIAPLANSFNNESNLGINQNKHVNFLISFVNPLDKFFRGKSELYTFVRFKIKNILVKKGYESSAYKSIELFPLKNQNILRSASKVIDEWSNDLESKGITACVVILPYEMQISNDANNYYKSIGIKYDKSFENFLTQEILKGYLSKKNNFFILKEGFLEKKRGHYFVFNKGDKIDFNHPNKNGHLVIAEQISKNQICQN